MGNFSKGRWVEDLSTGLTIFQSKWIFHTGKVYCFGKWLSIFGSAYDVISGSYMTGYLFLAGKISFSWHENLPFTKMSLTLAEILFPRREPFPSLAWKSFSSRKKLTYQGNIFLHYLKVPFNWVKMDGNIDKNVRDIFREEFSGNKGPSGKRFW